MPNEKTTVKATVRGDDKSSLKTPLDESADSFQGLRVGVKCECGSKNTVWVGGGGYQDADPSRGMPMVETNGQVACDDCGRTWWD